jgi:hypothetical protein
MKTRLNENSINYKEFFWLKSIDLSISSSKFIFVKWIFGLRCSQQIVVFLDWIVLLGFSIICEFEWDAFWSSKCVRWSWTSTEVEFKKKNIQIDLANSSRMIRTNSIFQLNNRQKQFKKIRSSPKKTALINRFQMNFDVYEFVYFKREHNVRFEYFFFMFIFQRFTTISDKHFLFDWEQTPYIDHRSLNKQKTSMK